MSGVKGRSGSGGARPGSGRKKIKTEREIKEELQKLLPDVYMALDESLDKEERIRSTRLTAALAILKKFVGDRQAVQVSGDEEQPVGVVILPAVKEAKKAYSSGKSETEAK
jgi:hypothetical protein